MRWISYTWQSVSRRSMTLAIVTIVVAIASRTAIATEPSPLYDGATAITVEVRIDPWKQEVIERAPLAAAVRDLIVNALIKFKDKVNVFVVGPSDLRSLEPKTLAVKIFIAVRDGPAIGTSSRSQLLATAFTVERPELPARLGAPSIWVVPPEPIVVPATNKMGIQKALLRTLRKQLETGLINPFVGSNAYRLKRQPD